MKLFTFLSMLCVCLLLTGCPKKKAEGDGPAEQVEGSSTSDKSGEGGGEEMQERKGKAEDPPPPAEGAEEKK